jgi:hypothetical protein
VVETEDEVSAGSAAFVTEIEGHKNGRETFEDDGLDLKKI